MDVDAVAGGETREGCSSKRKRVKQLATNVATACDRCRRRKRRCDYDNPCAACRNDQVACVREKTGRKTAGPSHLSNHRVTEAFEQILTQIAQNSADVQALSGRVDHMMAMRGGMSGGSGAPHSRRMVTRPQTPRFESPMQPTGRHASVQSWPSVRSLVWKARQLASASDLLNADPGATPCSPLSKPYSPRSMSPTSPQTFAPSPPPPPPFQRRSACLSGLAGPLSGDGLQTDTRTIEALLRSYAEHVWVVHPFLDLEHVDKILHTDYDGNGADSEKKYDTERADSHSPYHIEPQRRTSRDDGASAYHETLGLLVLALGSASAYLASVPNPTASLRSPGIQYGSIYVPHNTRVSACPHAPREHRLAPPGFEYYKAAVERLQNLHSGNQVDRAQALLLAGLFQSQLGRVSEAKRWFNAAGICIKNIINEEQLLNCNHLSLDKTSTQDCTAWHSRPKDPASNLICLMAWSCIQLESDLVADSTLPQSGIIQLQESIPWPFQIPGIATYERLAVVRPRDPYDILFFYTAQIWLRKRTNCIQRDLYGISCRTASDATILGILQTHEDMLEAWRQSLPCALQWESSNPIATDVLSARLRAQYWATLYVTSRPYLDFAVHVAPYVSEENDAQATLRAQRDFFGRSEAETAILKAISVSARNDISRKAKACVEAAMQSISVFDKIRHQTIVTNLNGTAHAQFGTVMVLSALYSSPSDNGYVAKADAQSALARTVRVLRSFEAYSGTVPTDVSILEDIIRVLDEC